MLTILQTCSHVVIENITIQGSSSDSGVLSSSSGIIFHNVVGIQKNITIRNINFVVVDKGIKSYSRVDGTLVYGCELTGNNTWDKAYIINPDSGYPNYSWNDDGICLPGYGNVAFNNTLRGFGDSFAVMSGVESAGVYFYRNLVEYTCDDACEGDYSTRNMAFYDNYVGNSGTLLSLDPVWGGPFYCFRNTSVNMIRGPFKLTSENSGALIYNNTLVKTQVPNIWGWYVPNNGLQSSFSYRNNLQVYRGSGTNMRIECDVQRIDFTHNAWYPNNGFNWTNAGGVFASSALAAAGLPNRQTLFGSGQRHTNDVSVTNNPWTATLTLGADHTTQYTAMQTLALANSSAAKNSGVIIPGITDGYSGGTPDIGAAIGGRMAASIGSAG